MSTRNLAAILQPRSVAVIGASARPRSIGCVIVENLLAGGFSGPILPVNPKYQAVAGVLTYPDIASLPIAPDLAILCTPPATVPALTAALAARGTKGVIVITAGFRELGSAEGQALEQAMLSAARPHVMRIVGPNCVGVISTPTGLNATFAHLQPRKGGVAFLTQSGAMVTTMLDWAAVRGIGFSHLVSLGDMADVDFGDLLDYLATDPATSSILLYIEAVTNARKFMSAARAAARLKPVVAIKAGRHRGTAQAVASHTGALAGIDDVYDAAFRRAGVLRVRDIEEVFDAAETLAVSPPIAGDRLVILTNGGGVGVLATDTLLDLGGRLAEISDTNKARLDAVLPRTWSHNNPVDIVGDAQADRYAAALQVLIDAPEADAILVLNCPTALAGGVEAAKAVASAARPPTRAILASWLGSQSAPEARRLFSAAGIPTYDTPDKAVRGFMHLVRYRQSQDALRETPPSIPDFTPDRKKARHIVGKALSAGKGWLDSAAGGRLLECYQIPMVRSVIATTPEEAGIKSVDLGGKAALKVLSPDILHKSDVGGVILDLEGAGAVREAAKAMIAGISSALPEARLEGFVVQEMIHRRGANELILGAATDTTFGPFLLFGHGGTAAEVIGDRAVALPPLNMKLARDLMARTRVFQQLQGYRDQPPAALDAIVLVLVKLSQLICDLDEVVELDMNPLVADASGVVVLDARVRVAPAISRDPARSRLAIRPYPRELEYEEKVPGFGPLRLRPVRPEDEPALIAMFRHMSPADLRLQYFAAMREISHDQLVRLTQIDYEREMTFILETADPLPMPGILGVVRLAADPDNVRAEFAITVCTDLKGRGLGSLLMRHLIGYARQRGIREIFGYVLQENAAMIALCRHLGFSLAPFEHHSTTQVATLRLSPAID